MKTVKGDLLQLAFDGEFDVVVHGCNCYCTMASGIGPFTGQVGEIGVFE